MARKAPDPSSAPSLRAPDAARKSVAALVARFTEHREELKRGGRNETEIRVSYINPFFEALGWDVGNASGYAESYKDVVHEAAVEVAGRLKSPDYSFRVGGQRKFFLEAKAPSVDVEDDAAAAFQLRRYAWSARLPVSLLTNFETLAVYQVSRRPAEGDKASLDRVAIWRFGEYLEKMDEIYSVFSKDAVMRGSFDRYAAGAGKKRGTALVDDDFLREMEEWRKYLAENVALRNPKLSVEEMNFAVQTVLDRILFLRIAEDRGIEDYGRLQNIAQAEHAYKKLVEYFHDADDRYNAGLFDFRKDKLTPALKVDDGALKSIVRNLYYPRSPYAFEVIGADVLGSVYERFLGSVIRLTPAHRAKVEQKPEVRKAGGVYYTPRYIVDYIVEKTVGEKLKGLTPATAANLKILDPACGSGSFLLGAYQRLLDWHLDWYVKDGPESHARGKNPRVARVASPPGTSPVSLTPGPSPLQERGENLNPPLARKGEGGKGGEAQWKLTIAERKRILLDNLFGVDIDAQAVEVAKLNLLLKVLEGETREAIDAGLKLFRERALPNIDGNIRCGNSLIGPDYFEGRLFTSSPRPPSPAREKGESPLSQAGEGTEGVRYKQGRGLGGEDVNAFDWKKEFPSIMKRGGFDVVMGNPPYGAETTTAIRKYYSLKYKTPIPICDSFVLFILQGLSLMNNTGHQGVIVPTTWLYMPSFLSFRDELLSKATLKNIVYFKESVFRNVTVETCILITQKVLPIGKAEINFDEVNGEPSKFVGNHIKLKQHKILKSPFKYLSSSMSEEKNNIFWKCHKNSEKLIKLTKIICGLTPYRLGKGRPVQTKGIVSSRAFDANFKKNKTYRQYLMGRDFHRYCWKIEQQRWISYGDWLAEPRRAAPFDENEKIVIRQTADSIIAQLDDNQYLSLKNIHNLKITDGRITYKYLLGILNSRLMTWIYKYIVPEAGRVFAEVKVVNLEQLPIRALNLSKPAEKRMHDEMVSLVGRMLDLQKKSRTAGAKTPHARDVLARQIDATDAAIDALVYRLYGLTEEEIRTVEGEG